MHLTNIIFSSNQVTWPLGLVTQAAGAGAAARACNFLRAANPAPDTEEEEELEQWRRPHRRTDGRRRRRRAASAAAPLLPSFLLRSVGPKSQSGGGGGGGAGGVGEADGDQMRDRRIAVARAV